MTIQTSFVSPEDDPTSWFTAQEVRGPAIITAVLGGHWQLFEREPAEGHPVGEFSQPDVLFKFFVPPGWLLKVHPVERGHRGCWISGYRLPPR